MNSLALSYPAWDLVKDASNNIALATGGQALAQNVASAQRLFQGELWYDTAQGVPWFADTLGYDPPNQLVQAHLEAAALTVAEVVQAKATITGRLNRVLTGYTKFTDATGAAASVSLT